MMRKHKETLHSPFTTLFRSKRPNEPDRLLAKPLTSEPARENDPVRVLDIEICSTIGEDEHTEQLKIPTQPLCSDVLEERKPDRVLKRDVCSVRANDQRKEPD